MFININGFFKILDKYINQEVAQPKSKNVCLSAAGD